MNKLRKETEPALPATAETDDCVTGLALNVEAGHEDVAPQQQRECVELTSQRLRFYMHKREWDAIRAIDPRLCQSPHREVLLALLKDQRTEDGGILLDCYSISKAVHRDRDYDPKRHDHHINIAKALREVMSWTESKYYVERPKWDEGRARVVYSFSPGLRLAEAIFPKNAGDLARRGLVDIVTGKPCSPECAHDVWHELRHAINAENDFIRQPIIRAFASYLNNTLTWGNFKYRQQDYAAVFAAIKAQFHASANHEGTTKRQRKHTYASATTAGRVMKDVLLWPQPLYHQALRSPRLHPKGNSLIGLPTRLRRMLKPNVIEYDLISSQMAVFAYVAGIDELLEYLRAYIQGVGPSWWDHCYAACGIERPEAWHKLVLKRVCYSIVFGKKKGSLFNPRRTSQGWHRDDEEMQAALEQFTPAMQARFFSDPLIKRVLAARTKMLSRIKENGGMEDAWGNWIAMDLSNSRDKFDEKSVLAYVCQSYEMRILEGVMQLAMAMVDDQHGFKIIAWQHDGFSAIMNRAADEPRITAMIHAAVREAAERLGIPAGVEIKYDGITGQGEHRTENKEQPFALPPHEAEGEEGAKGRPAASKGRSNEGGERGGSGRVDQENERGHGVGVQLLPTIKISTGQLPSECMDIPAQPPSPWPQLGPAMPPDRGPASEIAREAV